MRPTPLSQGQKKLVRIHFCLLALIIANALLKLCLETDLIPLIILPIKLLFCVLGLVLFFITVRPFRFISLYFSLFIISPLLALFSFIFAGMGGAIALSLLLM